MKSWPPNLWSSFFPPLLGYSQETILVMSKYILPQRRHKIFIYMFTLAAHMQEGKCSFLLIFLKACRIILLSSLTFNGKSHVDLWDENNSGKTPPGSVCFPLDILAVCHQVSSDLVHRLWVRTVPAPSRNDLTHITRQLNEKDKSWWGDYSPSLLTQS